MHQIPKQKEQPGGGKESKMANTVFQFVQTIPCLISQKKFCSRHSTSSMSLKKFEEYK
jgi:hypothetical protein